MKRVLSLLAVALLTVAVIGTASAADPLPAPQNAQVSPTTGGGIISNNGLMQWYIGPGSYSYPLKITYTQKTRSHFPGESWTYSDLILASEPFTLDIQVQDGGESVNLDKGMTLTIKYDPAELGGRSEAGLRVAKFDGARSQWFPWGSTTVDTVKHTVTTTEANEPGDYALIVYNVAPQPEATAVPTAAPAPTAVPAPAVTMESGIGGRVFYDRNGNGLFDDDDFPIGGAGLKISSGDWSAMTSTDAAGNYAFWSLRESSYNVELVVGPEWASTTPSSVGGIQVSGQAGSKGSADFGMWYRLPQYD